MSSQCDANDADFGIGALVAKRCKIGHDVLDLNRGEDGFVLPVSADAVKTVQPIVGRHDRFWVEPRGIHQAKPELAFAPATARTGKRRRKVALEPDLWK